MENNPVCDMMVRICPSYNPYQKSVQVLLDSVYKCRLHCMNRETPKSLNLIGHFRTGQANY